MFGRATELCEIAASIAGLPLTIPEESAARGLDWKHASWWISGLVVLADWIGSNQKFFPYVAVSSDPTSYWLHRASPQAEVAVRQTGVLGSRVANPIGFHDLFPNTEHPRPSQSLAAQLPIARSSTCVILEDIPGSGKTEAALVLAARLIGQDCAEGIYFALPTMATANAMYARLGECYKRLGFDDSGLSLSLAHGASRLNEGYLQSITDVATADSSASCSSWLSQGNKRALLAPISVGTIDQALLAVLPNRHQNLRLHALADKVLVVDEVHACDEYVMRLLEGLLEEHARSGGSAILLSATLPRKTRTSLLRAWNAGKQPPHESEEMPSPCSKSYPLLTLSDGTSLLEVDVPAVEHLVRALPVSISSGESEVLDTLVMHSASGRCAVWIRNTVAEAISAWEVLRERLPTEREPLLFHARFTMGDRLERESEVLETFGPSSTAEDRRGRILVATQVVEQSLDLDFDLLVSDLAPIDLLIQRAGRCRRHTRDVNGNPAIKEQRPGSQFILHAPDPDDHHAFAAFLASNGRGLGHVYPHHQHLWRSARLLKENASISMPRDARILIESVYDESIAERAPDIIQDAALRASGDDAAMRCLATNNRIRFESGYDRRSASFWGDDEYTPTRLGEPTLRLRLARWRDDSLQPWSGDGGHPWEYSEVSIRSVLFGEPQNLTPQLKLEMQRHLKHEHGLPGGSLLPLAPLPETDSWFADVALQDRDRRRFIYNPKRGLTWE